MYIYVYLRWRISLDRKQPMLLYYEREPIKRDINMAKRCEFVRFFERVCSRMGYVRLQISPALLLFKLRFLSVSFRPRHAQQLQ